MTTNSARPDALDQAADGFRISTARLHDAARALWSAADAYADHCPAVPLDVASSSRVGATLADARDAGGDLRHIAEAFRSADDVNGSGRGWGALATATDVALSTTILLHHPSLGRELTGPSRALERRGADLAEAILRTTLSSGAQRALVLLDQVPEEVLADPVFAAAVMNGIGADRLRSITEELAARAFDWKDRFGPLADLARLWTSATRSLDLPPRAARLDPSVFESLLDSAGGRNTLRALTGGSDQPAGERYLRQVVLPLLTMGAQRDEALSNAYRFLLGPGRNGHPDAPMIDAMSKVGDLRIEAFFRNSYPGVGTAGLENRTRELLDAGKGAQPAVVALLSRALADDRLDADDHGRDRTAVLRATYAWVEDNGPGSVTEPLAQMLANTMATDMDFYLGRVDTDRRGDLARVLQGVTEFERPWMTALLAFEHHGVRLVQETLHDTAEVRISALAGLSALEDSFEKAAAASDRPVDHASGFFAAFSLVTKTSLGTLKLHPIVGVAVDQMATAAIDAWHASTIADPDDHEARTRRAREGLRRRIWTVIAGDAELGQRVDWMVGGSGSDRHQHLGSKITKIEDLVALTPTDADLDELAGWAAAQPEDLRAMVEAYMSGTR